MEVKATVASEPGEHRVVFTTNEFHKARLEPGSYLLRLVAVPSVEHAAGIQTIADILDPGQALSMVERLPAGVRGGRLELRV